MCKNSNIQPKEQQDTTEREVPTLAIRGIRVKEALARFADDETRYRSWLTEFIRHGPVAVAQTREAIAGNDMDRAVNLTHAFKGRTGLLGIIELHSIARSLEMTLRNGEPTGFWLEELERTMEEIGREIATALGESLS